MPHPLEQVGNSVDWVAKARWALVEVEAAILGGGCNWLARYDAALVFH